MKKDRNDLIEQAARTLFLWWAHEAEEGRKVTKERLSEQFFIWFPDATIRDAHDVSARMLKQVNSVFDRKHYH